MTVPSCFPVVTHSTKRGRDQAAIAPVCITAEVVPNGFWPIDFGGALGEPVTRGIAGRLPWLAGDNASRAATTALKAAGLPGAESIDAKGAFARK
jgi:hypothetical protein